jgi:hypothetical protein
METIVLNAIMKRYRGLTVLYESMRDCEDTVLMNLAEDINNAYNEDEILKMINLTIN